MRGDMKGASFRVAGLLLLALLACTHAFHAPSLLPSLRHPASRTKLPAGRTAPPPATLASRPRPTPLLPALRASAAAAPKEERKTPVTLLSGFLGTGKTTSLKHILENKEGLRVGVIVNDVAEVNIDARLVSGYDAVEGTNTIELQNGCACCSISDELMKSVEDLLELGRKRGQPFDHIVIELSGVAEPSIVKNNFEEARQLGVPSAQQTEINHIVTVVDTSEFVDLWTTDEKLGERADLAGDAVDDCASRRSVVELLVEQIEAADRVILNKQDMATPEETRNALEVVKGIAGKAQVRVADFGKVPIDFYFDKDLAPKETSKAAECSDPQCTDESHSHGHAHAHAHEEACADPTCTNPSHEHGHGHEHSHSHGGSKAETTAKKRFGIDNFVYRSRRPFSADRLIGVIKTWPIPRKNLDKYFDLVTSPEGEALKKIGVLSDSPLTRVIRSKGYVWLDSQPRESLFWSHAGRHFSLDNAGKWWAEAAEDDLERLSKAMPKEYERMMRDEWEGEWGDRRQEIVFIGAGMEIEKLRSTLDACLLTNKELDAFREELNSIIELEAQLRFKVGDRVQCRCEQWETGEVIKVGYREDSWPFDQPDAPYQVRLDNGMLIWVPFDEDTYVRPA